MARCALFLLITFLAAFYGARAYDIIGSRIVCEARDKPRFGTRGTWWMNAVDGSKRGYGSYGWDNYTFPRFADSKAPEHLIVYVVDRDIHVGHRAFSHIANKEYLDTPSSDTLTSPNLTSHGTEVAAMLVGQDIGVLQQRALTLKACNRVGYNLDGVKECLLAIKEDLGKYHEKSKNYRAVINLSQGAKVPGCTFYDGTTFDGLFDDIIKLGGILVTAAGNAYDIEAEDACNYFPGCSPKVITVGAYRGSDTVGGFSHYGSCVNTWGPGGGLKTINFKHGLGEGTSLASPIVAGIVGNVLMATMAFEPYEDGSYKVNTDWLNTHFNREENSVRLNKGCRDGELCRAVFIRCGGYRNMGFELRNRNHVDWAAGIQDYIRSHAAYAHPGPKHDEHRV